MNKTEYETKMKELSQEHGKLVYELQKQAKENGPETIEKRWTGEQKEKFEKINADMEKSLADMDALKEIYGREQKIESASKRVQVNGQPLFEENATKGANGRLDAKELEQHQRAVFHSILRSKGGVKDADYLANRYVEENNLKGKMFGCAEFSAEKDDFHTSDLMQGNEIVRLNQDGFVRERVKIEKHALVVRDNSAAGAAVPPQQYADIIRSLGAPTRIMSMVRREVATGPYLPFLRIMPHASDVRYPTGYADRMVSEVDVTTISSATVQNQPRTGTERIDIHKWKPQPQFVSSDLVDDAPMFGREIDRAIYETYRIGIESRIFNGTGQDEMLGLFTGTGDDLIPNFNSGVPGSFTYEGILDMIFGLPPQYAEDPGGGVGGGVAFGCTRASHGKLYQVQNNAGQFVLPANTPVNTIMGYPIVHSEFIPAATSGLKAAIFGNFSYYIFADRQALMIGRIQELAWPDLYIQPVARFGGKLTVNKAFTTLTLT